MILRIQLCFLMRKRDTMIDRMSSLLNERDKDYLWNELIKLIDKIDKYKFEYYAISTRF